MNKILKLLVYALSASGLLTASFLVFASVAGIPLSSLPMIGSFFPEPELEASEPPEPATLDAQIDQDRRPPDQVLEASANPLHSFQLTAPWSSKGLEALELRLEARIATLEERTQVFKKREREQDERARRYDKKFIELEIMRENLLQQSDESSARQEELDTEALAKEAERRAGLQRASVLYAEDDGNAASDASMLLSTYPATEAGEILRLLEPERAAQLMKEIHKQGDEIQLQLVNAGFSRGK